MAGNASNPKQQVPVPNEPPPDMGTQPIPLHSATHAVVRASRTLKPPAARWRPPIALRRPTISPSPLSAPVGPTGTSLDDCRPYYLVPLLELEAGQDQQRWAGLLQQLSSHITDRKVTDIYVLAHGWHRNRFGALGAYDRLLSRFASLCLRGYVHIPLAADEQDDKTQRPLFLAPHWYSDPGEDDCFDPEGRRSRLSFLDNVRRQFVDPDPGRPGFVNDFNEIFEYMTLSAAPGADSNLCRPGAPLDIKETLARYALIGLTNTSGQEWLPFKVAMAWRCYHEAMAQRVVGSQADPPSALVPVRRIWAALAPWLALIAAALLVAYWHAPALQPLAQAAAALRDTIEHTPFIGWTMHGTGAVLAALLASAAVLALARPNQRRKTVDRASRWVDPSHAGVTAGQFKAQAAPVLVAAAWILPQLALLLVVAGYCLFFFALTLIVRGFGNGPWRWFCGEKEVRWSRKRAEEVSAHPVRKHVLNWARWPASCVLASVGPDSALYRWARLVDNQLATDEMQFKAIAGGADFAQFLTRLCARLPEPQRPRIHLIGHSFGALLAANTARQLALLHSQRGASAPTGLNPFLNGATSTVSSLQSLCLVNAAMASTWFEKETETADFVNGTIASLYSAYDTATGIIYSLGNSGRKGMGSVGMTEVPGRTLATYGKHGELAALSRPVAFGEAPPRALNLDASRLCSEGAPIAGGGHDDLFKEDVVNLVWSAIA